MLVNCVITKTKIKNCFKCIYFYKKQKPCLQKHSSYITFCVILSIEHTKIIFLRTINGRDKLVFNHKIYLSIHQNHKIYLV